MGTYLPGEDEAFDCERCRADVLVYARITTDAASSNSERDLSSKKKKGCHDRQGQGWIVGNFALVLIVNPYELIRLHPPVPS